MTPSTTDPWCLSGVSMTPMPITLTGYGERGGSSFMYTHHKESPQWFGNSTPTSPIGMASRFMYKTSGFHLMPPPSIGCMISRTATVMPIRLYFTAQT